MEGVAGIVHLHQVTRGSPEYERSCRWMTAETNAAIAGARSAGVTRIVVNDSHGDMRNLVLDDLDPAAEVISGLDKPFSMGAGLDGSFAAAFFVGYHASIGTPRAIQDHTYGGRTVYDIRVNGKHQSEATLNAALAGVHEVRAALITGDRACVEEAQRDLPGIEGVIVKEALTRMAARSPHPKEACRRIEEGAARALEQLDRRPLYRVPGPYTLEIDWNNTQMADNCLDLPGVERVSGRGVRYATGDYLDCYRVMLAMLAAAAPAAYPYPKP
jgi:D-amino peptidase